MSLELTAKLITLMPVQNIQGKNGPLTKQEFIVETEEQYPKKICISAWNETAKVIQAIKPFSTVKIAISVESREYNSRWYTDVKAWKIEVANSLGGSTAGEPQQYNQPSRTAEPVGDPMASEQEATDDLPF